MDPYFYAIFTNETSEVIKTPGCGNVAHADRSKLFGNQCSDCGILTNYADDTTYAVANKDRIENQFRIRKNLDELQLFLSDNMLAINMTKTTILECMLQQKKAKTTGDPPTLLVEETPGRDKLLTDAGKMRILGANIQASLAWSSHLETGERAVLPQARSMLGRLRHLGKLVPLQTRNTLARSLG